MLYAPSPYSSGTEVSVYEQDAYPTIDVTSSISSDADFNHETTTLPNATDEDNFFFLSQLQNDAAVLQQYNNNNNNNNSNNSNNNLVDSMDESNNNLDNNNNNNVYISYDNNFEENKNSNSKNLDDIIHEEDEDEEDEDEEEEEEEEENNTYNNINNHYHYLQQAYPFDPSDQSLYSSPTITDDDFETANRAFHATINKFSRQTYPEHRRRAPYSFLENWHLHSMYSKSQQILLGIAHVRPMVLLSGDDFMFTPPLLQQEDEEEYMDDNNLHHDHQLRYLDQPTQMDWIDGEEMFEDDGDILDDGIVIMSAPDPPNISHHTQQHHHHYNNIINNNNTNNRNDHDDHDEPLISHSTTSTILNENAWMKNTVGGNLLQQQEEEEEASTENDSLYFSAGFSSELVHWYRSSDRGRPPSTIMEVSFEDDPIENNNDNNNNNTNEAVDHVEYEITEVEGDVDINTNHEQYFLDNNSSGSYINVETEYIDKDSNSRNDTISISNQLTTSEGLKPLDHQHTHTIYQSLTDITPPIQPTPVTITDVTNNEEDHDDDGEVEDEEVLHKYGSISECNKDQFASTSTHHDYYYSEHYPFNYANFSNQLTATSDLVLTIASEYHSSKSNTMIDTTITENNNNNKKEMSFIQCLLCIWQVFFLTAELALAMLLGQHDQQQQLPVIMNNPKKSNRYRLNNNTNNAVTEHILPF